MKKVVVVLLIICLCVSLTACKSKDYDNAMALFEARSYQEALNAFLDLDDYKDSKDMAKKCMFYLTVLEELNSTAFFANGGSDTLVDMYSFTDETVNITTKENGKTINTQSGKYSIGEKEIKIALSNGEETRIPYELTDIGIKLGNGKYLDENQVKDSLKGYWVYRGFWATDKEWEYHIYIDDTRIIYEMASENLAQPAPYYDYHEPRTDEDYTLSAGCFFVPKDELNPILYWRFAIIDGEAVLLYWKEQCHRTEDGFPGRNGYVF